MALSLPYGHLERGTTVSHAGAPNVLAHFGGRKNTPPAALFALTKLPSLSLAFTTNFFRRSFAASKTRARDTRQFPKAPRAAGAAHYSRRHLPHLSRGLLSSLPAWLAYIRRRREKELYSSSSRRGGEANERRHVFTCHRNPHSSRGAAGENAACPLLFLRPRPPFPRGAHTANNAACHSCGNWCNFHVT